METIIRGLEMTIVVARTAFLIAGIGTAVGCALAWGVRTRRISPFGAVARVTRQVMDPLIGPVELRVIRAGGGGAAAPWWTLVAVLLAGFALLALLNFVRDAVASAYVASSRGPGGILRLAVMWSFAVLQLAILARVIMSWVGGTYSRFGRLMVGMTEWLVGPLRRVLPTFGAFDISPIVAWILLNIVQGLVLRAL
jgi:YggT family protein